MSIVFLRKNIERITRGLISGAITTDEAALICEYRSTKTFLSAYKSVVGKSLSKVMLDDYLTGMGERLTAATQPPHPALDNNTPIVAYFELTGDAWKLLANSIHSQNPNIVLDGLRFRGIQFANDWCRVAVTGPSLGVSGITPVLGFNPGTDLRTYEGYRSLDGAGALTTQELSAMMRGDK